MSELKPIAGEGTPPSTVKASGDSGVLGELRSENNEHCGSGQVPFPLGTLSSCTQRRGMKWGTVKVFATWVRSPGPLTAQEGQFAVYQYSRYLQDPLKPLVEAVCAPSPAGSPVHCQIVACCYNPHPPGSSWIWWGIPQEARVLQNPCQVKAPPRHP